MTGIASADVWTTEGGTHYLKTDPGESIKSWTTKEWQVWRKEMQSVGECMGVKEHCSERERSGKTPVENVPRVTAEDAQEGVKHAREEGGSLGGEVQNALDLAGEDAGTLPADLDADLISHVALGSSPLLIGVELGNGLDQLFEIPEEHPLTRVQEEAISEVGESVSIESTLREEEIYRELNPLGNGEASGHYELLPGSYLTSRVGTAGGPSFGVSEEGIECSNAWHLEGCKYFSRPREGGYVPPGFTRKEFTWDEGEYYPSGILIQYGVAFYEYKPPAECPSIEGAHPGLVGAKGTATAWACPPVGIPASGLITPEIEEHNVSVGLPARPKESASVGLPANSPSSLKGGNLKAISENSLGRESIEKMFPNEKREETEIEEKESEALGSSNPGEPGRKDCFIGKPVNCATGDEVQTETDLSAGGRGPGLQQALTYNSLVAVKQTTAGPFGFGWTGSYSAHLELKEEGKEATVYQDNGSTVMFRREEEAWKAPSILVQAILVHEGSGYTYTLPDQTKLEFNDEGWLTKETDRNGNSITLAYNTEKQLESATDGAGRKLTFKYNGAGEVENVTDPMGHAVKYTYESGNLASVTQTGETKIQWKYKYNPEHELTSATDGGEHATTIEYNENHRVSSQTNAMSRKRAWEYTPIETGMETAITEPDGAITLEKFNEYGSPTTVTHASGASMAATAIYEYNGADQLIVATDSNKHKTEYGYDSSGNLTSDKNADSDEKKWTYDSNHDIETETTPDGETTTIKRNSTGNPEVIERPAPGGTTQKTTYKYDADGDVESMTNPLERTWKYEYDSYGDRKSETDPEGNKRTWEYNEDAQEIATVSPRGNTEGAEASKFTTKTERNAQGRPLKVADPLGHTTEFTYDGDGNVETVTDGNSHKTTYIYNDDNEQIKVHEANGTVTETEYDSMGQVKSQIDGNKHATKYERNALGEITEVVDPLGHKTLKEYDAAGNLLKVTDPKGRITTYTYDLANRLTEVSYSGGNPSTIKYEYNKDGDRTKMTDGTGTTTYAYDQLDRMTESEGGHEEAIKYEYNIGNKQTKITYPNTKAVERAYDKDGRLEKITDWSSNITNFMYDADSDLTAIVFPGAGEGEDAYSYNDADRMTEVKMTKGSETLASLAYSRDNVGQVETTTSKGLPGAEVTGNVYDENDRLKKDGSAEYKYDAANNPTTEGSSTNAYNEGGELEKGTGVTYAYDELGERTKTTPEIGQATTYGYDQAGDLISVERPKESETAEIKDTYAYNGEGLRASQTISGPTSYLTWDTTDALPAVLNDGTNSYIYGPGSVPVEQINNSTGTVSYLHHDQQGSTRLLTGSTGTVTGKCTYGAYGTPTCEGTATTPLGYDGQYTSSDTGLIYLQARVYDPATAQFLTVDPAVSLTRAPYVYGGDNPLNYMDRAGLAEESIGEGSCPPGLCFPFPNGKETERGLEAAKGLAHEIGSGIESIGSALGNGAESVLSTIKGGGNSERNPAQDKKLTDREIKELEEAGHHPHELKPGGSSEDLYRDREGNIYVKPKGGAGPGEPTGINLRGFGGC